MKKLIVLGMMVLISTSSLYAQKVISGKSTSTRLKLTPKFERGIPPNLFVDMNFEDANNNGLLEANEEAVINLTITNKGKGPAQGLVVKVNDNIYDKELTIDDGKEIPYLYPEQSVKVSIPIGAGFNIKSAEHRLEISVTEHFGYDMDPAFLLLNSLKFQAPDLVFSGLELVDVGDETNPIEIDGQLQAGEQVKVKIVVQNIGQNVAKNTTYKVESSDANIYISDGYGTLGDLNIGEYTDFWVTISPNKRVSTEGDLPIYLTLTNSFNKGNLIDKQLPISLNQRPPETEIVEVKADIESLQKQVARFEYTSNKITANVGNIIDISLVPPSKTHRPNAIAVIIGVEKYDYFAPAPYAANDAEIIEDYFKQVLGIDKIYTYTDDQVSGFFFENKFNPSYGELQKAIVKGKTELFVFYSGHGMPSKDGENVYLFPSDGQYAALESQGYNLNRFYENLAELEAKRVTIFLDACFSGASRTSENYETQNLIAMKGVAIKPKIEQPWENNPNFIVFTSSDYDETSLGFDQAETGLFTYYVCAGLQGNADLNGDKTITTGELSEYVILKVMEISTKISGVQTPQFFGDTEMILGEF